MPEYISLEPEGMSTDSGMCGFNSTVNFNKVFKRITGKSPSEYRKWYQTDLSQLL